MKNDSDQKGFSIEGSNELFFLKLFVTGASPNSMRAISNITSLCENVLDKKYELEIIDVYQQPILAESEQIVALPLLIKKFPLPERRIIGDLSDIEKVLKGLGINDCE